MAQFRERMAESLEIVAKARREWMQGLNHRDEGLNADDDDQSEEARKQKATETKAWRAGELTVAF